jgi:hypothetical protein
LLLVSVGTYARDWEVQAVDPGGGGKYSSLRMDSFGNAHASYYNEPLHELKYAFWDHRLRRWFIMTLDEHCSGFTSLALDSQQRPHISYIEYGTGRLKYAHFDGRSWKSETIPIAGKQIDYFTSIALASDDRPIISYYEYLNTAASENVLHLRTVKFTGAYWELSTVDGHSGSGKFNAIAMGHDGNLQVAYANVKDESASLRYARWNGNSWDSEILEGKDHPQASYSVNLVLSRDDVPYITYIDAAKRLIRYATIQDRHWQFETVDAVADGAFPDRNGIALDIEGSPYISYYDAGKGILKVAHREGSKWVAEIVEATFSGYTPSIQVADGEIVITYFDTATNSFKCARRALPVSTGEARSLSRLGGK